MNSLIIFPNFRDLLEFRVYFSEHVCSLLKKKYEKELSLNNGISFTYSNSCAPPAGVFKLPVHHTH